MAAKLQWRWGCSAAGTCLLSLYVFRSQLGPGVVFDPLTLANPGTGASCRLQAAAVATSRQWAGLAQLTWSALQSIKDEGRGAWGHCQVRSSKRGLLHCPVAATCGCKTLSMIDLWKTCGGTQAAAAVLATAAAAVLPVPAVLALC